MPGDVYSNVVRGLADPVAGSLYVLATIVFGLHLHHGTASLVRSLGHAGLFERGIRCAALAFTALVTLGFLAPMRRRAGGLAPRLSGQRRKQVPPLHSKGRTSPSRLRQSSSVVHSTVAQGPTKVWRAARSMQAAQLRRVEIIVSKS